MLFDFDRCDPLHSSSHYNLLLAQHTEIHCISVLLLPLDSRSALCWIRIRWYNENFASSLFPAMLKPVGHPFEIIRSLLHPVSFFLQRTLWEMSLEIEFTGPQQYKPFSFKELHRSGLKKISSLSAGSGKFWPGSGPLDSSIPICVKFLDSTSLSSSLERDNSLSERLFTSISNSSPRSAFVKPKHSSPSLLLPKISTKLVEERRHFLRWDLFWNFEPSFLFYLLPTYVHVLA